MNSTIDLEWGGVPRTWLIPGTRCAWGARAILDPSGNVDLLGDRQDMAGDREDRDALVKWLNDIALPGVRENVKRWASTGALDTQASDAPLILFHDDEGTVLGTPNGSHGYLYAVAFLEAHLPDGHPTRGLEGYIDARKLHDAAAERFHVVCQDGETRGRFPTRHEAERFAEWGHACTRSHEIRDTKGE